jgi:hypothetical protein
MGRKKCSIAEDQDLATFLSGMVGQLRRDGLAITGLAHENYRRGDEDYDTLDAVRGGMDRMALVLEKVTASLCQECRMKPVAERIVFGVGAMRVRVGKREKRR